MLLTEYVDVRIESANKHYLENLGYVFPQKWSQSNRRMVVPRGTIIRIKIADAKEANIQYKCDNCGDIKTADYRKYKNKGIRGEDLCWNCYMGSDYHCGSKYKIGELNPNWHSDKTDEERNDDRSAPEYKQFVRECFERDNYTCALTGQYSGDLVVHHLKSYAKYKNLRYDIKNDITLSRDIHNLFHKKYSKTTFTDANFVEFKETFNG